MPAEYLFVFLGAAPRTEWLSDLVACDERGFVLTGPDLNPEKHLRDWPLERRPHLLETNVPGIFACGDVTTVPYKQIVVALGEGSKAALTAFEYLVMHAPKVDPVEAQAA